MKKLISIITLAVMVMATSMTNAQSTIDKIFEKYSGQEAFTAVNFSKEMFQMFQQMAPANDTTGAQMKDMLSQLTGLKVLIFNFDSTQVVKAVSVYNEFAGAFPSSSFKELMTVVEGRQQIRFLTKQDGAGKISELVMLMKDKKEVGAISITGLIDLSSISNMSKFMNIKGMENLNKIKDEHQHKH